MQKFLGGYSLVAALLLLVAPATSELEYYPGLRRPPPLSSWGHSQPDDTSDFLAQLIEENARRRLQQQLAQQHFYHQSHHQRGPNIPGDDYPEPSFTFKFPYNSGQSETGEIPFAVGPADARYYDNSLKDNDKVISFDEEMQKENSIKPNLVKTQVSKVADDVPYYKPKPPMNVNPKLMTPHSFTGRSDLNTLMEKLQQEEDASNFANRQRNEVVKKHVDIDGNMGMYVVALIAGVSAAVTVGLIALGIGWYTLHKKTKAAADVDYPAYGVTGPNKDISPSGDRRLAQSAQMYHYQHQKQQIIALENRQPGDQHGTISDVESDDDNEEGDYTVYECPGLAPTGEMEVKNPLFLDDTPVTPSTNTTENQSPPQSQQVSQSPQKNVQKKHTKPAAPSAPPADGVNKPKSLK